MHLTYKFCWSTQLNRLPSWDEDDAVDKTFSIIFGNIHKMTLFTWNLALIAKSALDQTKIADYNETYLSWIWLCAVCCMYVKANANKVLTVCIKLARSFEWAEYIRKSLSFYLFRNIKKRATKFFILCQPLLAYNHELYGWIQHTDCVVYDIHWMYSFILIDFSMNENILCSGYTLFVCLYNVNHHLYKIENI